MTFSPIKRIASAGSGPNGPPRLIWVILMSATVSILWITVADMGITQVYGILFTSFLIGTSVGPVAFGIAFESTGSYILMLIVSIVLMLISTVVTVLLPRYS